MKHMILFFTVICFCFVFFSRIDAQQRKGQRGSQQKVSKPQQSKKRPPAGSTESKTGKAEGEAKAKTPEPSPTLITESAWLLYAPTARASGIVTLTPDATNCWSYRLAGQITPSGELPVRVGLFNELIFVAGVQQKYLGRICFPAKGAKAESRVSVEIEAPMSEREGNIVVRQVFSIEGTVSTAVVERSPIFEIESDPAEPLVLVMKAEGLDYVSGKGSVLTPSGKKFTFPLFEQKVDPGNRYEQCVRAVVDRLLASKTHQVEQYAFGRLSNGGFGGSVVLTSGSVIYIEESTKQGAVNAFVSALKIAIPGFAMQSFGLQQELGACEYEGK